MDAEEIGEEFEVNQKKEAREEKEDGILRQGIQSKKRYFLQELREEHLPRRRTVLKNHSSSYTLALMYGPSSHVS